ncbi:MAG: hypothetical protein GWO23_19050 [Gammaproteobacteria bacterium]|nr:hypothetical protein [Gammaproteobacteria bacterium]
MPLVIAPLSWFLFDYAMCWVCGPQKIAFSLLVAINLPLIIPVTLLDLDDGIVMGMMFPLNGIFWGCVSWVAWNTWHRIKQWKRQHNHPQPN